MQPWEYPAAGFDPAAVFGTIGNAVGSVAKTITDFQAARDTQAYQRQLTAAQNSLELAKVNGAIDVEKLRQAGAAQQQQQLLNRSPLLSGFYPMGSGADQSNTLMLILTAAGVFLAWKALKK